MATRLCEICSGIPFKEIHDGEWDEPYQPRAFELGTLLQLDVRISCCFCQFISQAIRDSRVMASPSLDYCERHQITVKWQSGSMEFSVGPGFPLGSCISFVSGVVRTGRVITEDQVDPALIRRWLNACDSTHATSCSPPFSATEGLRCAGSSFRLIDVQQSCIVEAPTASVEYVALSYVWGRVPTLRLLKSNLAVLMSTDGLGACWHQIPETIRDAVRLVRKLEMRYLWVDTLCLVQDEPEDMEIGISMMDSVYERSLFTIIAGSGKHANHGLPGVRSGSRKVRQLLCEVLPGIQLVVINECSALLKHSFYNQRGWTFQEFCLSRRRITFVDDMVYFDCRKCSWAEDTGGSGLRDRYDSATLLSVITDPDFDSYSRLTDAVFYYSSRDLSYQNDYLNALKGICHRIGEATKCRFLQGIPVAALDLYLLFDGVATVLERRHGFPSWSWCGWIGPLSYNDWTYRPNDPGSDTRNNWLTNNTWIVWYERSPSGMVSPVFDAVSDEHTGATRRGDVSYRKRVPFSSGSRTLKIGTARTTPSLSLLPGTATRPYPILQFWTVMVELTLDTMKTDGYAESVFSVKDRNGQYCGYVNLDTKRPAVLPQRFNLIILSELSENVEFGALGDYDVGVSGSLYWAMYIEWDAGVAERRGLGILYHDALECSFEPGPAWIEILLG